VLAEEEAQLLANETLDGLIQRIYAGKDSFAEAVQELIRIQARGWDKPIRALVLRLHHYAQTLPNPAAWLDQQSALFAGPEPLQWLDWLASALQTWPQDWLPFLDSLSSSNRVAQNCADILRKTQTADASSTPADVLERITQARAECAPGKKTAWLKPLNAFLNEVDFLASLVCPEAGADPLAQDWGWVRGQMSALLRLCGEFTQAFAEAKRELGVVDFHDIEQHSLRLLWDDAAHRPTSIAREWQKKLRFVFVDEYQDINAAQDRIIQALSRQGSESNRFLVGDIKQSIYRFRLADPRIFRDYTRLWAGGTNKVIPLLENYRGRESLIEFTNSVFKLLMRRDLGGIEYDSNAALRFGAPGERRALSLAQNANPCTELHLLLSGASELPESEDESEALSEVLELLAAEKEARVIARRLRELRDQGLPIWDVQTRQFRPVDWRDMAILLRSPAKKAESYAKEFSRQGLPLELARGGFYQSTEISDLLSLLQLLDNPLQDIPALAVLHSPLVGLSAAELAEIRLAAPKARFWTALLAWHRQNKPKTTGLGNGVPGEAYSLVSRFLERFSNWRRLARQVALSRCLETVLAETHYAAWLLTQPRGQERHAHVGRLRLLAQEFDRFQRQGLFRFLKFVEAQQVAETEPEVASVSAENAVRLMSIHQSKGLEFPVVVVADTGKPFNLMDLRADIILDEEFGLCPHVKPPTTGTRYPSLPYWLAAKRQRRELLGEELRLLYVAMTRARDLLILSGSVSQRAFAQAWQQPAFAETASLLGARSYCDWLALWFSRNIALAAPDQVQGTSSLLQWFIHRESDLALGKNASSGTSPQPNLLSFDSAAWHQIEQRLSLRYAFPAATRHPAKSSVSALRRLAAAEAEEDAARLFREKGFESSNPVSLLQTARPSLNQDLAAVEVGRIHHQFLQLMSLEQGDSVASLRQEANRLLQSGHFSAEQLAVLDYKALAYFWSSDLGRRIRSRSSMVQRELAFTARFSPAELASVLGRSPERGLDQETVLVQGVADLVVIATDEIWLVDFKTDQLELEELAGRVKTYEPQLQLYAHALARIYRRPVTECWLYFLSLGKTARVSPPPQLQTPTAQSPNSAIV
jgi:ATP-dependent helicase/nuclease subunit A